MQYHPRVSEEPSVILTGHRENDNTGKQTKKLTQWRSHILLAKLKEEENLKITEKSSENN